MKRLLIVSGSPRKEESLTHALADAIADGFKGSFDVDVWKLGYKPVSEAEPKFHKNPFDDKNPKEVVELAEAVKGADLIALCTPIYNGSYSAHLKNALDCMSWDAFRGKRVLLASHGSMTAGIPLNHLQDVVRTMQGAVINSLVVVGRDSFNSKPAIEDEDVIKRIKQIAEGEASNG